MPGTLGTSQTHWARLPPAPRELPENWQEGAYLQTIAREVWRVGVDPVPAVGGSERLGNLLKITQLEKEGQRARLPSKQTFSGFPMSWVCISLGCKSETQMPRQILNEGLDALRISMDGSCPVSRPFRTLLSAGSHWWEKGGARRVGQG